MIVICILRFLLLCLTDEGVCVRHLCEKYCRPRPEAILYSIRFGSALFEIASPCTRLMLLICILRLLLLCLTDEGVCIRHLCEIFCISRPEAVLYSIRFRSLLCAIVFESTILFILICILNFLLLCLTNEGVCSRLFCEKQCIPTPEAGLHSIRYGSTMFAIGSGSTRLILFICILRFLLLCLTNVGVCVRLSCEKYCRPRPEAGLCSVRYGPSLFAIGSGSTRVMIFICILRFLLLCLSVEGVCVRHLCEKPCRLRLEAILYGFRFGSALFATRSGSTRIMPFICIIRLLLFCGKHCRPIQEAIMYSIWYGSTLFAIGSVSSLLMIPVCILKLLPACLKVNRICDRHFCEELCRPRPEAVFYSIRYGSLLFVTDSEFTFVIYVICSLEILFLILISSHVIASLVCEKYCMLNPIAAVFIIRLWSTLFDFEALFSQLMTIINHLRVLIPYSIVQYLLDRHACEKQYVYSPICENPYRHNLEAAFYNFRLEFTLLLFNPGTCFLRTRPVDVFVKHSHAHAQCYQPKHQPLKYISVHERLIYSAYALWICIPCIVLCRTTLYSSSCLFNGR